MNAADVINTLGGAADLARLLGHRPGAVRMWAQRNAIPAEHHLALWRLALERGLSWEPPGAAALRPLLDRAPAAEAPAEPRA